MSVAFKRRIEDRSDFISPSCIQYLQLARLNDGGGITWDQEASAIPSEVILDVKQNTISARFYDHLYKQHPDRINAAIHALAVLADGTSATAFSTGIPNRVSFRAKSSKELASFLKSEEVRNYFPVEDMLQVLSQSKTPSRAR